MNELGVIRKKKGFGDLGDIQTRHGSPDRVGLNIAICPRKEEFGSLDGTY